MNLFKSLSNAVLTEAIKENASDVHIETYENRLGIRFRIDGVMREVLQTRRALAPLVVSRIKVMSRLDIAEKRLPQDGRISLKIAGRAVDVRVSTIPSGYGERVVLRLLDKQAGRLDLMSLGMDEAVMHSMDQLVHKPHGIILGSGRNSPFLPFVLQRTIAPFLPQFVLQRTIAPGLSSRTPRALAGVETCFIPDPSGSHWFNLDLCKVPTVAQ